MASLSRKRQQRHARTFYITALLVSLLACYSFIRTFSSDGGSHDSQLALRSLEARDQECRLVHNAEDKCAFVLRNCPDEEAGLFSYLQLYYCTLPNAKPVGFTILVLWISLLFSTIGIAASDFLCINLSTIANILGMSESLTGVTFLAFGNGSPDVFSTFAAMSSNSGSLAVGELMGAAGFITAVVAGSMAITKPFQVAKRSFIRDVAFFAVAASFSLVFLADGRLHLWECVVMIVFYIFYVIFVVAWHWYMNRRRRMKLAETAARLHQHIPDQQELEVPQLDDDEESRPASERSALLRASSGDSIPTVFTPGTPAWKVDDIDEDDETRDRYLAEIQSNMRLNRSGRRERRNTMTPIRPSLIGVLEFRSVLSALEKKSTTSPAIGLRRYSDDPSHLLNQAGGGAHSASYPELVIDGVAQGGHDTHENGFSGRSRAVSANDAVGLRLDTDFLTGSDLGSQAATSRASSPVNPHHPATAEILRTLDTSPKPPSPTLLLSPAPASPQSEPTPDAGHQFRSPSYLAPPGSYFQRPDYSEDHRQQHSPSPTMSPRMGTLQVPLLHSPHPEHRRSPLQHSFPAYTDSPMVASPAPSRPGSIRLPAPSMSLESAHDLTLLHDEDDEEQLRHFAWWPYEILPAPQDIAATLFPTLYGWRSKGIIDKILGVITTPPVFCLTVTLPVVEAGGDHDLPDPDLAGLTPGGGRSRSNTRTALAPDTPSMLPRPQSSEGPPHPHSAGLSRQQSDFAKAVASQLEEASSPKDWHRWLVFVQIFTAPFFVVTIIWANMDEDHGVRLYVRLVLGSLVFSLVCLFVLLGTSSPDREPKYRPLFCFLGFAVAIAWISTIANEVVGVLKAIGVILNISDAILGLTIFAVGNSLGDLVADITVARLGYPVMALSACFGGPMLNILLGIGISGLYMTISKGTHRHEKHPDKPIKYKPYEIEVSTTLIISGVTLLVTLLGLLIAVPMNRWRMDRKIGWGLIAIWSLSTIGNVIVEVLGYGGDLELGSRG